MAMKGNLEMGQEFFMEIWNGYERSKQLEEENKKLKKELEQAIYWKVDYEKSYKQAEAKRDELLEENKNLREKLQWWKDLVQKAKEFEYDEDGMDYIWQNTKI